MSNLIATTTILMPVAYSRRPGWLNRIAELDTGTILLGAMRDVSAEEGEAGISYGLFSPANVAAIESELGCAIDSLIADGVTVDLLVHAETGRLCEIHKVPQVETARSTRPVAWHSGGVAGQAPMRSLNDYSPFMADAFEQHAKFVADFERRRQNAMKLHQPRWEISKAQHRGDLAWLPALAVDWLRQKGRAFLMLPGVPPEPTGAPAPSPTREPERYIPCGSEEAKSFIGKMRSAVGL